MPLPRSQTAKNQRTKDKAAQNPKDAQFPGVECPDGTLVNIPNRDPRLPRFYLVKKHCQVLKRFKAKRIFVYLQDTSTDTMEDYYKFLAGMMFPEGTKKGIRQSGFFYLQRGDYVFCRDISKPQEENDVLQLWIPSKGAINETLVERFKKARDLGLGARELSVELRLA